VAFAVYFYWLMQPNVVPNHGLAAYSPPPKAVVNYQLQRVPPAALEERVALTVPEPAPEIAVANVVDSKKEINKQEARTIPQRERPVRERPTPFWDSASSRSQGFRPWFWWFGSLAAGAHTLYRRAAGKLQIGPRTYRPGPLLLPVNPTGW